MAEYHIIEPLGSDTEILANIDEIECWTRFVYPTDFIPLEQRHDGPVIAAAGLADSTKLRHLIDRSCYLEYEKDRLECVADQANHFSSLREHAFRLRFTQQLPSETMPCYVRYSTEDLVQMCEPSSLAARL